MAGKKGSRWTVRPYPIGEAHPRWTGGERTKVCGVCGKAFGMRRTEPITTFKHRKFCSPQCGWKGQRYLRGPDNPRYRPTARRRNRGGEHRRWSIAVISRDNATCQRCGAVGVEMHAHHKKPYKSHPELRWDVSNGESLCFRCHWSEHSALNEKAVKTGDTRPGQPEGNPVPSPSGNIREGVTTRGRAYRRWEGPCATCGAFLSKPLSDVKGKMASFCGKRCMGIWMRKTFGPIRKPKAVTSSTSAAPARDDIV